jgi:hypothetical protein
LNTCENVLALPRRGCRHRLKKVAEEAYIDACRARVDAGVRAYRKQAGKSPSEEFEHRFFNDQLLLLDYMFVHLPGATSSLSTVV